MCPGLANPGLFQVLETALRGPGLATLNLTPPKLTKIHGPEKKKIKTKSQKITSRFLPNQPSFRVQPRKRNRFPARTRAFPPRLTRQRQPGQEVEPSLLLGGGQRVQKMRVLRLVAPKQKPPKKGTLRKADPISHSTCRSQETVLILQGPPTIFRKLLQPEFWLPLIQTRCRRLVGSR